MRILIADDQADVRSALGLLLMQEPDLQVVAEATDAVGVLRAAEKKSPTVVLLDWELPGLPAASLVRMLRSRCPNLHVIAMSSWPEARAIAAGAGVDAFVDKGDPPEALLAALKRIAGLADT